MNATLTRALIGASVVALLAVAGCGGSDEPEAAAAPNPTPEQTAVASTAPTTTAAATPAAPKTPQGWLLKKVGELGGLGCSDTVDDCLIKFQVDRIDVSPKCAQYGIAPEAGNRTLVLHISMTTGGITAEEAITAGTIFNPYSMKGLTPDGFVHEAKPGACVDFNGSFPNEIAPNSRYAGTLELELPTTVTTIASAGDSFDTTRGWAWPIP